MLVYYVGECMVSINGINNDNKEPSPRFQNWNTSQILIFDGYLKMRKSLYTQIIPLSQNHSKQYCY